MKGASVIAVLAVLLVACATPPPELPRASTAPAVAAPLQVPIDTPELAIDTAASTFTFTGYGPGKSHNGTFERMTGTLVLKNGVPTAASGVIDAASVRTSNERLSEHLRSDDFFAAERYPEIRMESTTIKDGVLTGSLTFRGTTRELTFPVMVGNGSISGDVVIRMSDYGVSPMGVSDEVRVRFSLIAAR